MYRFFVLPILALFCFFSSSANANNVAVGVNAGTLGYGAEVSTQLLDGLVLRLGGNQFSYSMTEIMDDIEYDLDAELETVGLIFDWHLLGNGFRFSFGGKYNGNELNATATPTTSQNIGGTTVAPAQIGTLKGNVKFDDFAPYVGIGFDNSFYSESKWSFWSDFGIMYQGEPKLTLTATGAIANSTDLDQEEKNAQEDLSDYKMYPVAAIGVAYRF